MAQAGLELHGPDGHVPRILRLGEVAYFTNALRLTGETAPPGADA